MKFSLLLFAAFLLTFVAAVQAQQAPPDPRIITYQLGPDSKPQEGVPQGKLEGPHLFFSNVFSGTVRKYWVYVPAQYESSKPAAVVVFQDGQRATNPNGVLRVQHVMDNLIHRKEMPVAIGIFITPGQRGEEYPDSIGFRNPNNRANEYDVLGDAYARLDNRNPENPNRDWYLQNLRLIEALRDKGYDLNVIIGAGGHADNHGGAILSDIMRWLWRDYPK